jgi:plastocyanin
MTRSARSIRRAALAAVTVLLMLLPATTAQASVLVKATGSQTFRPKRLEIGTGTKVVWKSVSGTHTVTAYSHNWSKDVTISTGQTTSFTFNKAGRYKYYCRRHGSVSAGVCTGMCGKVIVT